MPKLKVRTSLILQKCAVELPKIIASAETEPFFDETKRERVEVIQVSKLAAKIDQIFEEICRAVGCKYP